MASPAQVTVDMEIPGATSLGFAGLEWQARVSMPFVGRLDVTSTSPSLNLAGLLGTPVTVVVRGSQRRSQTFAGEIDRVEQLETCEGRTSYRLTVRPTMWRMALRSASRLFRDMTPVEVLGLLAGEHGIDDRVVVRTQGETARHAHLVQHDETDLAFVERLLGDAGLHYSWRQSGTGDTFVVEDVPNAARRRLTYVGSSVGAIGATAWTAQAGRTGPSTLSATGSLNLPGVETGEAFVLDGHPRADQNAVHVAVALHHRIAVDRAAKPGRRGMLAAYSAEVVAVPLGSPLPGPAPDGQATRRPVSPVAAVVTGPAGESVHVDELGRVMVRMPWEVSDDSSMRAPVTQPAAGDGRGTTFWPRVGDRVLVEFEAGDLGRPIVIGSVYDDDRPPPVELPDGRDQTALASESSRIVLDDRPGNPQLSVSTAGDHLSAVGGTHSTSVLLDDLVSVGGRRTSIVGGDRLSETGGDTVSAVARSVTLSIGGDQWTTVGGDRTLSVAGSEAVSVGGDQTVSVGDDRTVSVGGDDELLVDGELVIDVATQLVLRCGDASITLRADGDIEIEGAEISLEASGDLVLKGSRIVES